MTSDHDPAWDPGAVPAVGDFVEMQDQYGSRGWLRAQVKHVAHAGDAAIVTAEGVDGGGRITAPWGSRHMRAQ